MCLGVDTLVFSSDLIPFYGISDLFMSVRYNKVWSAPVNLGSEINTSGSELFPSFIPGNLLTFASNQQKDNKGGLDIYFSELPLLNKVFTLPAPINSAFDDFALKFHKSRDIAYFVSNRNRNSNDDIFRLDIQKLYRTFSGRIFDMNSNSPVINAAVIFSNCRGGTINTVLSDTSGYFSNDILSNECVEIEIVADGYQSKTANISNINSLDFRLISKQYYELLVVDAENNLPLDSVLITNQNNVNFYTNPQGLISIKPPLTDSRRLTVTRNGYLFQELTASPLGNSLVTRDTVYLVKKQPNTIIFRKSVLANSDELKILEESTSIYEEIIKILERSPDLKVEIGWHSDSRGNYNDNMRQTRNRSVFAVSYLERRGIDKNRIVGKGYGESQLLNRCRNGVNCTEEEHSVNRRIELKIIGFVEPDEKPAE
jgi:outer membrane protein OmpA-like peptidoglycan-associated protein